MVVRVTEPPYRLSMFSEALSKEVVRHIQAVARVSGHCQLTLNQPCNFCVDACEEDAIRIDEKRVQIDETLCTGCGECSLDCYDKAIALLDILPALKDGDSC